MSTFRASDPSAEAMIELLGGTTFNGVTFSRDQWDALAKYYDFSFDSDDALLNAGATRNLGRHVQADGMRVMAIMAKFLERGEDPVQMVASLMIEAGYDVPLDPAWVYGCSGE